MWNFQKKSDVITILKMEKEDNFEETLKYRRIFFIQKNKKFDEILQKFKVIFY